MELGEEGVRVAATSGALVELGFPAMGSAAFVANHGEFKRELRLFLVHWVFLFIFADCLAEGL